METETRSPTKEEMVEMLSEQIAMRSVQLDLQRINTEIAELKFRESTAYVQWATIMKKGEGPSKEHVVTQEDLDNNPEMAAEGVKLGDTVLIPMEETL